MAKRLKRLRVDRIDLVDRPAVPDALVRFYKADGAVTLDFPVVKLDDEQRIAYGYALVSDVVDRQGDLVSLEEIEHAAHEFLTSSREAGEMHVAGAVGEVVESVVVDGPKLASMGVSSANLPGTGAWWIGIRIGDDRVWEAVKSGRYGAFSIQGAAQREDLPDLTTKAADPAASADDVDLDELWKTDPWLRRLDEAIKADRRKRSPDEPRRVQKVDESTASDTDDLSLSAVRKRLGLSQAQIGKSVGYSQQMVAAIEKGERRPNLGHIQHFSAVYNIPQTDLIKLWFPEFLSAESIQRRMHETPLEQHMRVQAERARWGE